jgi:hypothetical protein
LEDRARALLQRVKVRRGRPVDEDRKRLAIRIAGSLRTADASVTTFADGTFGQILNAVFADLGLDRGPNGRRDARDVKKALLHGCAWWSNRPRNK